MVMERGDCEKSDALLELDFEKPDISLHKLFEVDWGVCWKSHCTNETNVTSGVATLFPSAVQALL